MATPVDLQEFVAGFVMEAEEYLDSVNQNLVAVSEALKQNRSEPKAVRELFRSLHTIKGLASMIGAEPIVAISHEMESILRTAERAGGYLPESIVHVLIEGTRAIEERVRTTAEKGVAGIAAAPLGLLEALTSTRATDGRKALAQKNTTTLPEEIANALSASEREQVQQAAAKQNNVAVVEFQPSVDHASRGLNITSIRERVGAVGEIIRVLPRSSASAPTGIVFTLLVETKVDTAALAEATGLDAKYILLLEQTKTTATESVASDAEPATDSATTFADFAETEEWTPGDQSSVRVDIRKLDETLERLGELVVTRSKLTRVSAGLAAKGVDNRELNSVLAENSRQLKRLRAAITKARMVPLSELFQRLPLVVRGLTRNSEKSVDLEMHVGLAEVDKAVADKIFPAIVHLIRNSFDHAVESKSHRRALGKPETAKIAIQSDDSSGTNLLLTIRDDGRGIDREAVARKSGRAIAKNDEELLQQICAPGLSTSQALTTTSGRGMGMDIVKRTIEKLGGRLSLQSVPGSGTTFTLQVPVSITIVDVLSFVSGEQTFAVPLAMVDEIIEVRDDQVVNSPVALNSGAVSQLIQRRGVAIPFLSLNSYLYHSPASVPAKALIINQSRGSAIAFGIDRMLGQQEVLVRPIGDSFVRIKGLAGATDLGDGKPTIVLDLATMGTQINHGTELV